jgi:hypothetical protein
MQGGTHGAEETVQGGATGVDDNGDHDYLSSKNPAVLADIWPIEAGTNPVTEFDTNVTQTTFANNCKLDNRL